MVCYRNDREADRDASEAAPVRELEIGKTTARPVSGDVLTETKNDDRRDSSFFVDTEFETEAP